MDKNHDLLTSAFSYLSSAIDWLNGLLWGSVLIYLLIGVGLYFTLRLKFIQLRHFGHMFSVLRHSRHGDKNGVSSFQALCTSLAARVGTGNLAGVAVALTLGGPGAIFWMWLIAFIGMSTSFVESTLAQLFKQKDSHGAFRGGPAYYMERGLKARWMGVLFAFCLILAFGLVFCAVQSNSIAQAAHAAFDMPRWAVGVAVVALTALVIFGGLRTIAGVAEIVVPFMAFGYLAVALVVVAMNIHEVPAVFSLIIKSAFGLKEATAGAAGYGMAQAMMQGMKRGLFSNEAGMGSAPNAAATASPTPPHPASQGYVQMLGVFVDTLVICTATAAIILTSGVDISGGMEGVTLTQTALSSQVGNWGNGFVAVALFFFAFTSIMANYYYAEINVSFLAPGSDNAIRVYRFLALGMVMFGAIGELPIVWAMADVAMALMAIVNLVAILLLSGIAFKLARDYNCQRAAGKTPFFDVRKFPELKSRLAPGVWEQEKP
ncbi:alanine/glycine:cation symporter family protein [Gallaecimonas kandeliae]|uniref:alanine/glycine:cation symporter family protein n=1 Tax=Gallaecimonas kandeliae TaxID=3029055 RepID=UPI002649AA01|nr:alanine/glycine:cation symporter family protein [Gallaecimonas kandeliae]WKE66365.1 alanine/glycine:cation symporter family protein [Gallaecimonas kandeliae]